MKKHLITAVGMALALPALPALATNGYFAHGYGLKAKGMGGVATALSQDSFGGANNPASMASAGSRMDVGLDWFRPARSAERSGAGIATLNGGVDSDSRAPAAMRRCRCARHPSAWPGPPASEPMGTLTASAARVNTKRRSIRRC